MNHIQIVGWKGTGSRAVPSLIYFGRSSAEALQAARDRCHEDWSSMVKIKNPRGHKVPFRTMRAESFAPPPEAGLFLPPGETETPPEETKSPAAETETPSGETEAGDVETILAQPKPSPPTPRKIKYHKEPIRRHRR